MCRRTRRFDFFPLQSRSHPHYAGVSQFKALARGAPVRPSGRISGNINNKLVIISCMSLYSLFRHRAKTYRESSRRIESGCGKLRWLYAKRSDKPTRPGDITRINELGFGLRQLPSDDPRSTSLVGNGRTEEPHTAKICRMTRKRRLQ